ncbi:MAG: hypothetical protein ACYSWU_13095 [Planctomycetota bacterium]|jgi:hypothetical protein
MLNRCVRVVMLVALGPIVTGAAEEAKRDPDALSLSLRASKKEIAPCEALLVTLRLSNPSSKEVAYDGNMPALMSFFRRVGDGSFEPCALSNHAGHLKGLGPAYLSPGEADIWDDTLFLFWPNVEDLNGQAFVFPRPGKYRIKARGRGLPANRYEEMMGETRHFESNEVEILVKQPSAEESAAMKLITDPQVALFVQRAQVVLGNERAVPRLEKLVAEYPATPYADFANFRLAQHYSSAYAKSFRRPNEKDYEANKPRMLRFADQAFKHFGAVSARNPGLQKRAACKKAGMLFREGKLRDNVDFFKLKRIVSASTNRDEWIPRIPYLPEQRRKRLRAVEILFVKDDRLDKRVHYRFGKSRTKGEVLKDLSEQAGVPLDTDAMEKARVTRPPGEGTCTLREFMWKFDTYDNRCWERRGKGYFLVIEREPKTPGRDDNKPVEK